MTRRPHLDWLRGIAVLIMIEAHTIDSWTRAAGRTSSAYQWSTVIAGFGAPAFLFLAGIALLLAAGGRSRRGLTAGEVTRSAFRRGLWIFALAFLFRLQSVLISGASFQSLLKVDILNIMGISMMVGALGLAIAASCHEDDLAEHGGNLGSDLFEKSRKSPRVAESLPSQRKKISLSTGPIRQLPPLEDELDS